MTNKELMEKLIQYPEDAIIEILDGCTLSCMGNDNVIEAEYEKKDNKIIIY